MKKWRSGEEVKKWRKGEEKKQESRAEKQHGRGVVAARAEADSSSGGPVVTAAGTQRKPYTEFSVERV